MIELAKDAAAIDVTDLLTRYNFDLSGYTTEQIIDSWLRRYPAQWIRLAVIESLYQGRYKAISVEQILNHWQRRGKTLYRFNHEFERVICGRFPYNHSLYHPSSQAGRSPSSSSGRSTGDPRAMPSPLPPPPPPVMPAPEPNPVAAPPLPSTNGLPEAAINGSTNGVSNATTDKVSTGVTDSDGDTEFELPPEETCPTHQPIFSPLPKGSPVQPFKPSEGFEVSLLSDILSRTKPGTPSSIHRPIDHFVPAVKASGFHAKLRAVAQSESSPNGGSPQSTAVAEPPPDPPTADTEKDP